MNTDSIVTFVKTHKKSIAQKTLIAGGVAVGLILVLTEASPKQDDTAMDLDESPTDELELDVPEDPKIED